MRRCDFWDVSEKTKLRMNAACYVDPWTKLHISVGGFLWSRVMLHLRRWERGREHSL